MAFRLYKEGEGVWARGALALLIGGGGLYGGLTLYNYLSQYESWTEKYVKVPLINWVVDVRMFPVGVLLIAVVLFGVWAYNRPRWVDFLIDTESELKNRVTWPSRKEVVNNTMIVVVTVVVLGALILWADTVFQFVLRSVVYPGG